MRPTTLARAAGLATLDPEFTYKARGWTGSITVVEDGAGATVPIRDGRAGTPQTLAEPPRPDLDNVLWSGDPATWDALLASPPPPGQTDPWAASTAGLLFEGGPFRPFRHAAVRRFCELMRHAEHDTDPTPRPAPTSGSHGQHDEAVGRYVHLDIDGFDHRLYYERAGTGIPLLCMHTAGADGRQWRHFLEDSRITEHFDVITYDLPYHGKSLPPAGTAWWAQEYKLTLDLAMKVPLALAEVLGLDRPAFIGSSIGGMLALDLARYHPDRFRAVVAVEGSLKVERNNLAAPRIVDVYAREDPGGFGEYMGAAMSPTASEAARSETKLGYAQSAPGVFLGDTNYYRHGHDLVGEADKIDTSRCMVYLLTGEYDHLCVESSERAHREIKGSEFSVMKGLGHFPMSEDHEQFCEYAIPVLQKIVERSA